MSAIAQGGAAVFRKIYLEITNCCNLRCDFCPGTGREKRFLSLVEFSLLAEKLRPHTDFLYFHVMGEPLLHPLLPEFLARAGELGFRVILTTNGTLLPACREILLAARALHKVNVSLHAPEANGHLTLGLESYVDGCARFAADAADRGILCSLRLWNLDGAQTRGENACNGAILERLRGVFSQPWTENSRGWRLRDRVFLEWGERFEWPDLAAPDRGEAGFCMGLRDQVAVLCDGTVVPCCLDHEGDLPLGNLFQTDLQAILDGPSAREMYDGFSARKRARALCRRCGYAQRFQENRGT